MGPEIQFTPDVTCILSKEVFMLVTNRAVAYPHAELQPFSSMLRCSVYCSITFAKTTGYCAYRDDTDIVCLRLLSEIGLKWIYVHTEPMWNIKVRRSYWNKLQLQQDFGKHINKQMLYVHAISSCDTYIKSLAPIMKLKSCQFFLK